MSKTVVETEMWTLDKLVALTRRIEEAIQDCSAHVAIGGSVVMKGWSDKDGDIYIYPTTTADSYKIDSVIDKLHTLGVAFVGDLGMSRKNGDSKIVFEFSYGHFRLDVFFLYPDSGYSKHKELSDGGF